MSELSKDFQASKGAARLKARRVPGMKKGVGECLYSPTPDSDTGETVPGTRKSQSG